MAIAQSFIQELLARADVVEVVGRYVQLKKSGANFMGLCPFHAEKTPSFSVSPAKQFYHCFSCGKHGDAINFLMEHTGASFTEAVHDLAQQCGLSVPEDTRSPQEKARDAQQSQRRATLSQVLARASQAYRQRLKDAPRAIGYLKKRGLTGQIASRFALGYAPEGWRTLAGVFPDYADPLLVESGLVIAGEGEGGPERRYDRFRDRIMFPIRSVKGEVIGFGARVLGNEKPKYLNSPETPVFHKGSELYGLYEARAALREKGYALVVEGYMDVVALAQLGFANAVATLGTACTPQHVQKLFRFTASVVFSFDGDAAGQRAASGLALRQRHAQREIPLSARRARPRQLHPHRRRPGLCRRRGRRRAALALFAASRRPGLRHEQRRRARPLCRPGPPLVATTARRGAGAANPGRHRPANAHRRARAGPALGPEPQRIRRIRHTRPQRPIAWAGPAPLARQRRRAG